jgi:hypothetical protein
MFEAELIFTNLLMLVLNIEPLKLIILENATVVKSSDENATQKFFINCIGSFPRGCHYFCKPFAEPVSQQA